MVVLDKRKRKSQRDSGLAWRLLFSKMFWVDEIAQWLPPSSLYAAAAVFPALRCKIDRQLHAIPSNWDCHFFLPDWYLVAPDEYRVCTYTTVNGVMHGQCAVYLRWQSSTGSYLRTFRGQFVDGVAYGRFEAEYTNPNQNFVTDVTAAQNIRRFGPFGDMVRVVCLHNRLANLKKRA